MTRASLGRRSSRRFQGNVSRAAPRHGGTPRDVKTHDSAGTRCSRKLDGGRAGCADPQPLAARDARLLRGDGGQRMLAFFDEPGRSVTGAALRAEDELIWPGGEPHGGVHNLRSRTLIRLGGERPRDERRRPPRFSPLGDAPAGRHTRSRGRAGRRSMPCHLVAPDRRSLRAPGRGAGSRPQPGWRGQECRRA